MENQKIKKSAGRLSPTPMGDYDDTTTYRRLDWVYYGGTTYICKKNNTLGIKPSDPERWQKIIDEIGDMEIIFTEAEQLENITNEDKLSIIFGKIKKWFTHFNDIICRDNNDTKVTRIRADEGVQVSNRANDRHIPVYASDFVAGTGGTTGRSLANLSLKDLSDNNYIDVLTNINQITSIGFWKIGSIDSSYAQSIGIRAVDNVGDFYALVSNYNGDGSRFNYGNLQLFSPRLGVNHFEIRVWNGAATARHAITYDTMLNTTEQISANTESFYAAGALAVKAMMADYNNKINQINSNMNTKISGENFSYNWVAAGADYVCTIHRVGLLMIKRGTAAKLCAINPEGVVTIALEYGNESELYFAQDITIEPIPPDNDWHKVMLHNNARSGIYVFRLSI